ncbi:hypothetical protein CEXT_812111 [Caerostris extrusa]|uniref:Uncharacterized protein n=1 Tax=Caerostris extrusa TaxID=172846 RepID=A0AAV4XC23_CAEEX|nr:hypothetical protein CEXT_812111 [Caerostris extrusa]
MKSDPRYFSGMFLLGKTKLYLCGRKIKHPLNREEVGKENINAHLTLKRKCKKFDSTEKLPSIEDYEIYECSCETGVSFCAKIFDTAECAPSEERLSKSMNYPVKQSISGLHRD